MIIINEHSRTTDPFLKKFANKLRNAKHIATLNNKILKRYKTAKNIYYAMYDKSKLIAILHLVKHNDYYFDKYFRVTEQFRGLGYLTFMFDYAVVKDRVCIVCHNKTPHDIVDMWLHFNMLSHFDVKVFDLDTNTINETEIVDKNNKLTYIAVNTGKSIYEIEQSHYDMRNDFNEPFNW